MVATGKDAGIGAHFSACVRLQRLQADVQQAVAGLALNPDADNELPATTPWAEAPPLRIHPRLREYGEAAPRGPLPKVRERDEERALLARQLREEHLQVEAARARLATGHTTRLSELGHLDPHAFALFLSLLGEALTAQSSPDDVIERQTGDGLLSIRLEPLEAHTWAEVVTDAGIFTGRDHRITITAIQAP